MVLGVFGRLLGVGNFDLDHYNGAPSLFWRSKFLDLLKSSPNPRTHTLNCFFRQNDLLYIYLNPMGVNPNLSGQNFRRGLGQIAPPPPKKPGQILKHKIRNIHIILSQIFLTNCNVFLGSKVGIQHVKLVVF